MTKYEYLKNTTFENAAKFLCELVQDVDMDGNITDLCERCPATRYCYSGHNGFIDWLKEDHKK